jgi:hypothetical protein
MSLRSGVLYEGSDIQSNIAAAIKESQKKLQQTDVCGYEKVQQGIPQFDTFKVTTVAGPVLNSIVNLKEPRKMLICKGNDDGGSTADILFSFYPLTGNGLTGSSAAPEGVDLVLSFKFPDPSANNGQGVLYFKKPVQQFYISWPDNGQPGSTTYFYATDDWITSAIINP